MSVEAIREIEISVGVNGTTPTVIRDAGVQGEHKATRLKFTLGAGIEGDRYYLDIVTGQGKARISEDLLRDGDDCYYEIPAAVTDKGVADIVFNVGTGEGDSERLVRSYPIRLMFRAAKKGEGEVPDEYMNVLGLLAAASNDATVAANLAALIASRLVVVSDTEPTHEETVIWLNPDAPGNDWEQIFFNTALEAYIDTNPSVLSSYIESVIEGYIAKDTTSMENYVISKVAEYNEPVLLWQNSGNTGAERRDAGGLEGLFLPITGAIGDYKLLHFSYYANGFRSFEVVVNRFVLGSDHTETTMNLPNSGASNVRHAFEINIRRSVMPADASVDAIEILSVPFSKDYNTNATYTGMPDETFPNSAFYIWQIYGFK